MGKREKIVIDTSYWVDQVLYPGAEADKAIQEAQKKYTVVHSWETLTELAEVLSQKRHDRIISPEDRAEFLQIVMEVSEVRDSTHKVSVSRDVADDKFLGLAMSCGAADLLSKDKDLREIKHYQGVQIWSAEQFSKIEEQRDLHKEITQKQPQLSREHAREELTPARAVQPEPQRQQVSRPPTFDPKYAREEIAPARKVQPEPSRERQVQPPPQPERPQPAPAPQSQTPQPRRDYEREM